MMWIKRTGSKAGHKSFLLMIWVILIAPSLLVISAGGCGQSGIHRDEPAKDRLGALKSVNLSTKARNGSDADDRWNCPANDNVTPADHIGLNGYDYSSSNSFRVCVSRDDVSKFQISGSTTSRAICIYPLQVGNTTAIQLADNPKCFTVTGGPIEAKFTSKNINYMAIVDVNFTNAMNTCLSSASPCPAHSEGFVQ